MVFAGKVSHSIEYANSAIECLIQQDGENQFDVDVLYRGFKSREAYAEAVNKKYPGAYDAERLQKLKRQMYNDQIPECHKFYSRHRCWMLDPHDPLSLDGCGEHFGVTPAEIAQMKKDPSSIDKVMETVWNRNKEVSDAKTAASDDYEFHEPVVRSSIPEKLDNK